MKLPEERPAPRATPARWLGALAVSILVLAAANAGCLLLMSAVPINEGFGLVNAKWRLLRGLDRPVDWLILGDSSGNQGVDPEIIRRATGERALNLCTIADCLALDDAWMLDEYLQRFGPPKRVVLVHVVDGWHREAIPLSLLATIPVQHGPGESPTPAHPLTAIQRIEMLARQAFPIVFQNRSLAYHLLGRWIGAAPVESVIRDDGFNPRPAGSADGVIHDVARNLRRLGRRPKTISPLNAAALAHLRDVARREGIDLVVANSPISERLARDAAFAEYRDAINRQGEEILRAGGRGRLVLAEPPALPDAVMQSSDHATIEGARLYTHALVDAVLAAAPADRRAPPPTPR